MNIKFLAATSFLIALLCHLVLFNLCIIVFSIAPDPPKPKFFFLGSILKQNDVLHVASNVLDLQSNENPQRTGSDRWVIENISYGSTEQKFNPFAIRSIKKPLEDRITSDQDKVMIKSTFDTALDPSPEIPVTIRTGEAEIKIRPYKPLQFRIP